jgi:uncharacterized membrane protein YqgA involved in biofilm formation
MIGLGTVINVIAILVGSAIGVALGHRLPQRTRDVVTDGVGLAVLLVAALSAAAVLTPAVSEDVGASGVLIVLGSLLIGGILGSLWRIEARLEGLGESIRLRLSRRSSSGAGAVPTVTVEETLETLRRARGLEALRAIRRESRQRGLDRLSPSDIDAIIARTRKARAPRRG